MANINPVQIEKFLKGMKYPATKMDVISCADHNGADKQIHDMLERLPDQKYEHPTDVSKAISSLERRGAH